MAVPAGVPALKIKAVGAAGDIQAGGAVTTIV